MRFSRFGVAVIMYAHFKNILGNFFKNNVMKQRASENNCKNLRACRCGRSDGVFANIHEQSKDKKLATVDFSNLLKIRRKTRKNKQMQIANINCFVAHFARNGKKVTNLAKRCSRNFKNVTAPKAYREVLRSFCPQRPNLARSNLFAATPLPRNVRLSHAQILTKI